MEGMACRGVLRPKRCLTDEDHGKREIVGAGFRSGNIQRSDSTGALLLYMSRTRPPASAAPWDHVASKAPKPTVSIFVGTDRGAVLFLAFLVLATIVLPMVTLSQVGQFAVSGVFALTLIFGAFATIQRRFVVYLVIGLTLSTVAVDLFAGIGASLRLTTLDTALKLVCLNNPAIRDVKAHFASRSGHRVPGDRCNCRILINRFHLDICIPTTRTAGSQRDLLRTGHGRRGRRAAEPFDLLQLYHPHHCWLR
jgi:hypothetical protein